MKTLKFNYLKKITFRVKQHFLSVILRNKQDFSIKMGYSGLQNRHPPRNSLENLQKC